MLVCLGPQARYLLGVAETTFRPGRLTGRVFSKHRMHRRVSVVTQHVFERFLQFGHFGKPSTRRPFGGLGLDALLYPRRVAYCPSSGSGEIDGLTSEPARNSSRLTGPAVAAIAGGSEQSASKTFQTSVRPENGIVTFLESKPPDISRAIGLRVQYHSLATPFCGGVFDC